MGVFDNKVVIITGSGGGLGRSHALFFAREGAKVVVNDLGGTRDGKGTGHSMADSVCDEIKKLGSEAVSNYDSVTTEEGANNIVQSALKKFGRIDVLVNNAGILRDKTMLKMKDEWHPVIDVHLNGTYYMMQAVAKAMVDLGNGGRIINTTSVAGLKGNYGQSNYAAAKAGIYGLTLVGSMEFAKYNITVNAIAPIAKTRMTEELSIVPDELRPEHISPMVVFLASDKAKDVNGRVFGVHGTHIFEYKMMVSDGVKHDSDWTLEAIEKNLKDIESFESDDNSDDTNTSDSSPKERLKTVFERMPEAFLPDKATDWNAVMHFVIKEGGDFTITIKDSICTTNEGLEGTSTCVVKSDIDTFLGILDNKIDGQQAFMQGKITATNIGDMMNYGKYFSRSKAGEKSKTDQRSSSPKERLKTVFERMPDGFLPDKATDWNAVMHFVIKSGGDFTITVQNSTCTTSEGLEGTSTCVVKSDIDTFLGMVDGKIDGQQAFMQGKITATNIGDMMKYSKCFSKDVAQKKSSDNAQKTASKSEKEKVESSKEKRPVEVKDSLYQKTFHEAPVCIERTWIEDYAKATGDNNPRYIKNDTPPLLVVRQHIDLAKRLLTDDAIDADIMRLVHGEQEIIFHSPMKSLDIISPKLELYDVVHKESGSIIKLRFRLMRDGDLINESFSSYFVRSKKKVESSEKKEERKAIIESPDFEEKFEVLQNQSRDYAKASLDINPIHVSDDIAKAAGFKGVILHGLCTMAIASHALVNNIAEGDPTRLISIKSRFSKPVLMGDILTTRAKTKQKTSEENILDFEVINQEGIPVITNGQVVIKN